MSGIFNCYQRIPVLNSERGTDSAKNLCGWPDLSVAWHMHPHAVLSVVWGVQLLGSTAAPWQAWAHAPTRRPERCLGRAAAFKARPHYGIHCIMFALIFYFLKLIFFFAAYVLKLKLFESILNFYLFLDFVMMF